MTVHVGGDHAAFELQQVLVGHLRAAGHDVVDHGPHEYDAEDDYPVYVLRAAEAVAADPDARGVVLGGSGNGEQIAANKVFGVRAALAWTPELARLARQHNDARIVSIGGRFTTQADALAIVDAFLSTDFTDEARHVRRLDMVTRYEQTNELPALQ